MQHRVYRVLVSAVTKGTLKEPFSPADFESACPGFGKETYRAFLKKHSVGNPAGQKELFESTAPGMFELIRPFKYGI